MLFGIFSDAFEKFFRQGMDAAFPLDGFYHDGTDVGIFFTEFYKSRKIVGRCIEESFREGIEIFMKNFLSRGGEGGNGASVESVDEGDDDVSVFIILIDGIFPGAFDGAFIGFGTGIGKEDLLHTGLAADHLRQVCHRFCVEQVGYMVQGVKLLRDGFHPFFVGNAEDINAYTASQVDVIFSIFIGQVRSFAFDKTYGISGIGMGNIGCIFFFCIHRLTPLENRMAAWAVVFRAYGESHSCGDFWQLAAPWE